MQAINKYRPFKTTGDDFISSNPIFAFYFYRYFLQAGVSIYKDVIDATQKSEMEVLLKQTQLGMNNAKSACEKDLDQAKNMKDMLQYTELMFAKNDHNYREGHKTKQIAQDFLTINRLYQIVGKFGGIDEGQSKRKIYSKKKFIDIMKQIKSNPQQQSKIPPPPQPVIQQKLMQSTFKAPLPKPTTLISYNKLQMQNQATKCLQNALSQLTFDRFKFAREDVLRALELLDQLVQ